MEAQKKRLKEQLKTLTDEQRKDDLITFEELGIDCLMVDEAHNYKTLPYFQRLIMYQASAVREQRKQQTCSLNVSI